MAWDTTGIHYEYEGRNGKYYVDVYNFKSFIRTVDSFKTKKQALLVAEALNAAYRAGMAEGAYHLQVDVVGAEAPETAVKELNYDYSAPRS